MKKSIGKFVLTAAAILAITMSLWSCGNSSNNNNGGPTADASGSIVLPSGVALNPSSLHVTSASGTVTVGSNGSYTVTEPAGGGAATVLLTDANDNVVMLGHVDTDNPSFNEISPTSTAVEILFFATGSFTLPQTTWPDVYRILAAAPETATLAGVISTQMAANPTAVGDMDPVIVNAIRCRRGLAPAKHKHSELSRLPRRGPSEQMPPSRSPGERKRRRTIRAASRSGRPLRRRPRTRDGECKQGPATTTAASSLPTLAASTATTSSIARAISLRPGTSRMAQ